MNRFTWAGLLLAVLSFSACDSLSDKDEGVIMQARLIRMPDKSTSASKMLVSSNLRAASSSAAGQAWTSEVDIHSLRTPIVRIWITDDNETRFNTVYDCDPVSDPNGCLVNLHGTALQNLLASDPHRVMPGTYTRVGISNCVDGEKGYSALVAGSATLGGKLMYTKADGTLSDTGPAEEASVLFNGCARMYAFTEALVIADTIDTPIPLQLFFDIQDIARVADGTPHTTHAYTPSGCTGTWPDSQAVPEPFICIGYPDVAATIATEMPHLERYRVNKYATIGLFFHPETDKPFGGYTRRYFVEGEDFDPGFGPDTPLREIIANEDGTYRITSFGGTREDHGFRALNFQRADHSGTFTSLDGHTNELQTGNYTAVKLDD